MPPLKREHVVGPEATSTFELLLQMLQPVFGEGGEEQRQHHLELRLLHHELLMQRLCLGPLTRQLGPHLRQDQESVHKQVSQFFLDVQELEQVRPCVAAHFQRVRNL